jgi:hypothetical protein
MNEELRTVLTNIQTELQFLANQLWSVNKLDIEAKVLQLIRIIDDMLNPEEPHA